MHINNYVMTIMIIIMITPYNIIIATGPPTNTLTQ